jgi:hypothetical protein
MPTLDESLRAPAESSKFSLFQLIQALIASRFWPTRLCFHKQVTLPINNRQHCLGCGASRLYLFDMDFEHADAGIEIGPWKRPALHNQDAHRVVASRLIDNAVAAGRRQLDGRSAILNPGSENSLFQRRDLSARDLSAQKGGAR